MTLPVKIIEHWKKEIKEGIYDPVKLLEELKINPQKYQSDLQAAKLFPIKTSRHFLNLIEKGNIKDPLLMQIMPNAKEFIKHPSFTKDPLLENNQAEYGLLQKYKNRVLLFFNTNCAINCRYCFRRHFPYTDNQINQKQLQNITNKLKKNSDINEVILSGGDPLFSDDKKIAALLNMLAENPNIDTIRIHTRLPVVIPNRLTIKLAKILAESKFTVIIVTHINHPQEISKALVEKINRYKAHNIKFLNQSVLLKDINDNHSTLIALSKKLFHSGIMPYYLHLLDKTEGTKHFEVNLEAAKNIIRKMQEETSGYLVPKLVQEETGKKSKSIIPT